MKKLLLSVIVMILFSGLASNVIAQGTATATANSKVLSALSISRGATDLNFGSFIPSTTLPGSVTIDNEGAIDKSNVTLIASSAHSAAAFTITCAAGSDIKITIPTQPIDIKTGSGIGLELTTVDTWIMNGTASFTMPLGGSFPLLVGAKLNVKANQATGTYISDGFAVTVAYP